LAEQLLTEYKQRIRTLTLAPYGDGRFEVFINSKKVYSKHATGNFPEYEQVRAALEKQTS
jgi:selT/selW/selH-like putative selenoprotein